MSSIEKHLQQRPTHDDLAAKNILHHAAAVAPALHSAEDRLHRARVGAALSDKLDKRVPHNALVDTNIARDPRVAPTLQSAQDGLRRSLATLSLKGGIDDADAGREERAQRSAKVATRLEAPLRAVEHKQKQRAVLAALSARPDAERLAATHILDVDLAQEAQARGAAASVVGEHLRGKLALGMQDERLDGAPPAPEYHAPESPRIRTPAHSSDLRSV